jgi:hypothetical protein
MVVGKVVMRIPWFGWVTIFVRDDPLGLPVIIAIVMLIAILEFVLPVFREKNPQQENQNQTQPKSMLAKVVFQPAICSGK